MIISLSHIDLDGVSCQIVLSKHFQNVEYLNCNYDNIKDYFDIIKNIIETKKVQKVFVTDLSFNENTMSYFNSVVKECNLYNPNIEYIIIDHHPSTVDCYQFINVNNIELIADTEKCATKLTYEYFKSQPENLLSYVNRVNAYDIWLDSTEDFLKGIELNDLFWNYKLKRYFNTFVNNINKDKVKTDLVDIKNRREKYFASCINKKLISECDNAIISFCDEFIGWLQILYKGKMFYINATSYGKIHIRIGDWITSGEAQIIKENILNGIPVDRVVTFGGHDRAFSLQHEGKYSYQEIVKYVEIIYNIINNHIKGKVC